MRSPFAFFRRHRKVLLAGLGVVAMFGFVILPVIVEGIQLSRTRNIVVATSRYGTLRESTLAELMRQRGAVLRFLNLVGEMVAQAGESPTVVQQALMQIGPATEDAVVNRWLLARYAEELGLSVDARMVNAFISDLTQGKISGPALEQALEHQGISVSYLFQVLEQELLALRVRDLFLTQFQGFTPAQHWDYFQRFNRRAKVETVALPVDRYLDQVTAEPSAAELRDFFEKHRYQVADPDQPDPGFLEPKRVVIEYLKAPYDKFVEVARPRVTDKEIEDFYVKNKDRLYREEPLPTMPGTSKPAAKPEATPSAGESQPAGGTQQTQGTVQPPSQQPESAGQESAPSSEPPAQPPKADQMPSTPSAGEPADSAASSKESSNTSQIGETPQAPSSVPTPPDSNAAGSRPEASPDSSQGSPSGNPPADASPSDQSGASADTPQPGDASAQPVNGASAEPGDGDGSETATEAGQLGSAQQPEQPAGQSPANQSPSNQPASSPQPGPPEQPKYKPLEQVREEIRNALARDKAQELMGQLLNKIQAQLTRYREDKILYDLEVKQRGSSRRAEPQQPDLEAIARENSLEYRKAGPLTSYELAQLEIAQATTALGGDVLEMLFHRLPLFRPTTARDFQGNQYLVWKIEETPSRIPSLDDPGMREKVIRVWKFLRAREIARAEAEKLAEQARQAKKPLGEVFAGRADLKVEESEPFSWLSSSLPFIFLMQERPRISQVKGVDRPGEEFMRTVFSLRAGEVGVAMNHPQTVVYVIRVLEVQPPDDILWQQFTSEPARVYLIAAQDDMLQNYSRLLTYIREKANFQWTPEWQRRRAERPAFED